MLTPVEPGPAVVVCNSCRHRPDARHDDQGQSGGQRLFDALCRVKDEMAASAEVAIQQMPCLFACGEACTIHLRAPGKIGYILGRFNGDEEGSARAIMDYAVHYAASAEGRVPYGDWPEGIKGHFIARVPPPGFVAE
ncbi:DUF1636 domain-containing protein [Sphingopyxis sp. MWB1]|uniref:DUF1636 domain-containing protein n=1 Tax=Sphingopyxis sp. MWB1 TaxID=1537715 RepID=UPI00051A157F|nr:DUF1636 domain-containing protein [Sphingopyxis sp. MWB1]